MPRIPQYEDTVNPEGILPGQSLERLRAEPDAFGGGAASALSDVGAGLSNAGTQLYQVEQANDVSNQQVVGANVRAQAAQLLLQHQARAGDPGFMGNFASDLNNLVSSAGDQATTRAGAGGVGARKCRNHRGYDGPGAWTR